MKNRQYFCSNNKQTTLERQGVLLFKLKNYTNHNNYIYWTLRVHKGTSDMNVPLKQNVIVTGVSYRIYC